MESALTAALNEVHNAACSHPIEMLASSIDGSSRPEIEGGFDTETQLAFWLYCIELMLSHAVVQIATAQETRPLRELSRYVRATPALHVLLQTAWKVSADLQGVAPEFQAGAFLRAIGVALQSEPSPQLIDLSQEIISSWIERELSTVSVMHMHMHMHLFLAVLAKVAKRVTFAANPTAGTTPHLVGMSSVPPQELGSRLSLAVFEEAAVLGEARYT